MNSLSQLSEMDVKDLLRYKNTLVICSIFLLGFFFLRSAYQNYQDDLAGVERKLEAMRESEAKVIQLERVEEERDQILESFHQRDLLALRRFVEQKAQITGISVRSSQASQSPAQPYFLALIDIEFRASYQDLLDFIRELEKNDIFVNSVSLRRGSGSELSGSFKVEAIFTKG